LAFGEVIGGAEKEEVAGRGSPAVRAGVEVDRAKGSPVDGVGGPVGGGGGGGHGGDSGWVWIHAVMSLRLG